MLEQHNTAWWFMLEKRNAQKHHQTWQLTNSRFSLLLQFLQWGIFCWFNSNKKLKKQEYWFEEISRLKIIQIYSKNENFMLGTFYKAQLASDLQSYCIITAVMYVQHKFTLCFHVVKSTKNAKMYMFFSSILNIKIFFHYKNQTVVSTWW